MNREKLKEILMHKIGDLPVIVWAAIVLSSGAMLTIYIADQPPEAPPPPVIEKTAEQLREEKIATGFSKWDGSHKELTKIIKTSMNDPKSYEHIETTYYDKGDFLLVTTKFRGTNKFGAVVPDSVTARVDLEGNVVKIIDQ